MRLSGVVGRLFTREGIFDFVIRHRCLMPTYVLCACYGMPGPRYQVSGNDVEYAATHRLSHARYSVRDALKWIMLLRICYEMSGTDAVYPATSSLRFLPHDPNWLMSLCTGALCFLRSWLRVCDCLCVGFVGSHHSPSSTPPQLHLTRAHTHTHTKQTRSSAIHAPPTTFGVARCAFSDKHLSLMHRAVREVMGQPVVAFRAVERIGTIVDALRRCLSPPSTPQPFSFPFSSPTPCFSRRVSFQTIVLIWRACSVVHHCAAPLTHRVRASTLTFVRAAKSQLQPQRVPDHLRRWLRVRASPAPRSSSALATCKSRGGWEPGWRDVPEPDNAQPEPDGTEPDRVVGGRRWGSPMARAARVRAARV